MIKRNDIELMAPVGSYENLTAAIQGGADSIYFGVEKLNMRSGSTNNFTFDDLKQIAQICKEHNLKSYLTINTVIYPDEIELMKEIVDQAKRYQINAIIASDQSVINYASSVGMEVHLSTQLNISNFETVKFYSHFADVMVLARELNLDQVKNIYDQILKEEIKGPSGNLIKLEMFIHGALCVSISGKCYLSLHEYNKSANRGQCLQICRRAYTVTEKETANQLDIENEYILSPKDLCTISFLNKMIDSGIRVLKIEGRARSPEYVKMVTQCYNEAIVAIEDGSYGQEKIDEWKNRLSTVFNRGFWDGYYLGQRLGEWSNVYGSKATKKKTYLGKITNYYSNIKVAEVLLETGDLNVDDEILITGPSTGAIETIVKELRVELQKVKEAKKGCYCSIPIESFLRRSDKLFKITKNE